MYAPSRLRKRDRVLIARAAERFERFIAALPVLLECRDAAVVAGALLVAAADGSAILLPELLIQVIDPVRSIEAHGEWAWMTLRLGDAASPWRNLRRWLLDPISLLLASHLTQLPGKRPTPAVALEALSRHLGWQPLDLSTLLSSARARWAIRLPSWLLTYALQPAMAPSLPPTAWWRLLNDRPLPRALAPKPARVLAAEDARARVPRETINLQGPQSSDGDAQRHAVRALMRLLRPRERSPRPTDAQIRQRLTQWQNDHGALGGWVALLGAWTKDVLCIQKHSAYAHGDGWPRVPGLLRYLEGFALPWVTAFHDLPPTALAADEARTQDRLDLLRLELARHSSASIAQVGLRQFLAYVRDVGGPAITLDSEWRTCVDARDADANWLTPGEYLRLRAALRNPVDPDGYDSRRLQAMAIIGYRMGPRWQESQTLRLRDLQLIDEPVPRGSLKLRANPYFLGKTRDAFRKLRIEHYLTEEERIELGQFVCLARQLGGRQRNANEFLFAEKDEPHRPPRLETTHDVIQKMMRKVSGDPSLVYHHLRHSTANSALVRLGIEEIGAPDLLAWIPYAEVISAHGWGLTRPWMTELTDRPQGDATWLHAISETLGQMSPDPALRHYLHLVDVAMVLEVRRHMVVAHDVQAAVEGIQTSSLRKRRYRDRKRSRA